jgi:hypothetical protein
MASEFIQKFDTTNKAHVEWLGRVCDGMAKVTGNERYDIVSEFKNNPMGCVLDDPLQFAEIHFMLSLKYTTAVLCSDQAYVPPGLKKNTDV